MSSLKNAQKVRSLIKSKLKHALSASKAPTKAKKDRLHAMCALLVITAQIMILNLNLVERASIRIWKAS